MASPNPSQNSSPSRVTSTCPSFYAFPGPVIDISCLAWPGNIHTLPSLARSVDHLECVKVGKFTVPNWNCFDGGSGSAHPTPLCCDSCHLTITNMEYIIRVCKLLNLFWLVAIKKTFYLGKWLILRFRKTVWYIPSRCPANLPFQILFSNF